MSKVKIKKVKSKTFGNLNDISEMFYQLIGTNSTNAKIVYPKIAKIRESLSQITKYLAVFADTGLITDIDVVTQILSSISQINELLDDNVIAIGDYIADPTILTADVREHISNIYHSLKDDSLIEGLIASLDRIEPYSQYINHQTNPNVLFTLSMPDFEWKPFTFLDLNVCAVISEFENRAEQRQASQIIANIISNIYLNIININNLFASPDIDIDEFTDVIIAAIKEIKHVPELSRCQAAFSKIEKSVDLLRSEFGNYYNAFAESGDFTVILQSFISDVSNAEGNLTPKLSREFITIMKFYTDKLDKLKQAGHNVAVLEKLTKITKMHTDSFVNNSDISESSESDSEPVLEYSNIIGKEYSDAFPTAGK